MEKKKPAGYARNRRRKRRRQIQIIVRVSILVILVMVIGVLIYLLRSCVSEKQDADDVFSRDMQEGAYTEHPMWTEDFLTPNPYSRPGYALEEVKNIFVHYVANPGTTAKQNRDYFNQLGQTKERSASAHFIIGLDGEIIQCVPLEEIAYAVKSRNHDSISIECCHPYEDGAFTEETYKALLELLGWLLDVYNLEPEDVLRHYDSNGKLCPLYYVEHEEEWEQLKRDIR